MKLSATSKYVIAAGVGACLCFGLGFGIGEAAANPSSSKDAATLNKTVLEKKNTETGDFDMETEKEWEERGHGGEMGQDMLEKIQEAVDSLDDDTKSQLASILGLSESDLDSISEETLEKAMEAAKSLSEEDRQTLMELMGKEGFGMGRMERGFMNEGMEEGFGGFEGGRGGRGFQMEEDAVSSATGEKDSVSEKEGSAQSERGNRGALRESEDSTKA